MRRIGSIAGAVAPLAVAFAMTVALTGAASAASAERCIIYARDYARAVAAPTAQGLVPARPLQEIQDAAYARCRSASSVPSIPKNIGAEAGAAGVFLPSFDEVFGVTKRPPTKVTKRPAVKPVSAKPVKVVKPVPVKIVKAVKPAPVKVRVASRPAPKVITSPVLSFAAAPAPSGSALAINETFGSGGGVSAAANPAPIRVVAPSAGGNCKPRLQNFWRGTMQVTRALSC